MMDSAKRLAGFGLLGILVALLVSTDLPGRTSLAQAQTGPPPQVVHDYVLQSSRRISRTLFEHTYEAYVSNWGDQDASISANLAPLPSNATIVDGALDFGFVPQGATVKASDTFTIRHDRTASLDEYALLWWVEATPAELTTYELIDQGNANGEIDDETVLVYKLFADYDDERLPAQYRGRDDAGVDGRAIEAVRRNFAGLSQPTQDLLAPFLMRPDEPGSWAEVQAANEVAGALSGSAGLAAASVPIAWSRIQVVVNGVPRAWVWWMRDRRHGDQAVAEAIKAELEGYLWNKLTEAFHEPVADDVIRVLDPGGSPNPQIQPNPRPHGPDGLLDIYLTNKRRGEAPTVEDYATCTGLPQGSYIVLGPAPGCSTSNMGLCKLEIVAHELMHALVASYKLGACVDAYHWMNEATATWAQHFAYQGRHGVIDTEQPWAADYLRAPPERPLDPAFVWGKKCPRLNPAEPDTGESLYIDEGLCGEHQYGAYLWFLNLTNGERSAPSDAAAVHYTWVAAANHLSIRAIDSVLGGFQKNWPTFLANNWNRLRSSNGPHRAYYSWDHLNTPAYEQSGGPIPVRLPFYWIAIEPIFHQLPPLAAQYNRFDFTKDQKARQVWYYNDYAGLNPNVDVRAIVKLKGQWKQAEDWSGDRKKIFCRDDPDQDIQELVLIISNLDLAGASDPTAATKLGGAATKDESPLRLVYSPVPCHDWVGSVSFRTVSGSDADQTTTAANADGVRFRFDPLSSDPLVTGALTSFNAVQGSVGWHIQKTSSDCATAELESSFPAAGQLVMGPTGTGLLYYLQNQSPGSSDEVTVNCSGGPQLVQETFSDWLPPPSFFTITNSSVIEDRHEYGYYPGDGWIWRFTRP